MPAPPKATAHSDEPPEITPEASLAADDPTAVWDVDALREAGLDEVLEDPESAPAVTQGQASAPPSIVTQLSDDPGEDPGATEAWDGPPLTSPPVPAPTAHGSGWGTTLALAIALGTAAYFAVRFLR